MKLTVVWARTATPRTRPLSACRPEGMSAAFSGTCAAFMHVTVSRSAPAISRWSPAPNKASTITSPAGHIAGEKACVSSPASRSASWADKASPCRCAGAERETVTCMNAAQVPVIAADIPSGLHADSGRVLGVAVRAHTTVSFIGLKQGLFTGDGPAYCGDIVFDDLGVPASLRNSVSPAALRILDAELIAALPPRPRTAHKGDHGHVLVIGGDRGMAGAARLAAEAALRVGR